MCEGLDAIAVLQAKQSKEKENLAIECLEKLEKEGLLQIRLEDKVLSLKELQEKITADNKKQAKESVGAKEIEKLVNEEIIQKLLHPQEQDKFDRLQARYGYTKRGDTLTKDPEILTFIQEQSQWWVDLESGNKEAVEKRRKQVQEFHNRWQEFPPPEVIEKLTESCKWFAEMPIHYKTKTPECYEEATLDIESTKEQAVQG